MENCSLDHWYNSAKTFNWRDHQVYYKEEPSNKDALVLIHGFPTASYDWWKIWDRLSERFSLIALDMIGFGYSSKAKDFSYSIVKQADLILDLLRLKGIDEFHILAHDYGDTVAQEILARANDGIGILNIKSVCLLNGGIFPESHHPLLIQKLLMSPLGPILSRLLNQQKFEKSFLKIFGLHTRPSKEELAAYWKLISRDNGHRIAHKLIRYMRERVVQRERWVRALVEYKDKLALINGPADPISGMVMVNRYREIISEDNIWLLEDIGHYPQLEAPEEVLAAYFEFLDIKKRGYQ